MNDVCVSLKRSVPCPAEGVALRFSSSFKLYRRFPSCEENQDLDARAYARCAPLVSAPRAYCTSW